MLVFSLIVVFFLPQSINRRNSMWWLQISGRGCCCLVRYVDFYGQNNIPVTFLTFTVLWVFKTKPWSTPRLVLCFTFYGSFLIFCRARPISTLSAIWVLGRQRESHFGDLEAFWLIDSLFSFLVSHILLQRLIPFSLCLLWHILVFLLAVVL